MTDHTVIINGVCQRYTGKRRHTVHSGAPMVVTVEPNPHCAACLRMVQVTPAQAEYCAQHCQERGQ